MDMYINSELFQIRVKMANTFFRRLKGLMFQSVILPDQGIVLSPCFAVHTCFMRFPIDVVYLDEDFTVLEKETIPPWRMGKRIKGTKMVLETAAGAAEQLEMGMCLVLEADTVKMKGYCNE